MLSCPWGAQLPQELSVLFALLLPAPLALTCPHVECVVCHFCCASVSQACAVGSGKRCTTCSMGRAALQASWALA